MRNTPLNSIVDARFRASPEYELVLFDRLPREQQEFLSDLQKDPDFYGILRPRAQNGLGIKSVCRETSLLYFTLQEPGTLPAYVKTMFGEECNQAITELVLDGVLQIEWNGTFVSGSDAYPLIYAEEPLPTGQGTIARLSVEALKYAQALEMNDVLKLSARMYFYNRVPAAPAWRRRFPTSESVAEYLGVQVGGSNRSILDRAWSRVSLEPPFDGWLMWKSRRARPARQRGSATYKLYVSPDCAFVRDAFQAALEVFSDLQAPYFKIGKDVHGLLRPDKMVAYFSSFEALEEAAGRLGPKLAGVAAHGVPFSAELAADGLLSWGIDPPRQQQTLPWQEHQSWRLWITNRLATALLAAKASAQGAVEPWQFALERLRLEGVDITSWTPTTTIWHMDAGVEG